MPRQVYKAWESRTSNILEGKLWELRLSGRAGIARALYVTAIGQRIVVLRAFVKKTQKTPRSEIEIALHRAKEIR